MWRAGTLLTALAGTGFAAAAATLGVQGPLGSLGVLLPGRDAPRPAAEPAPAAVVGRLREIFRAQDDALVRRDASALEGVFAPGCPCLPATRARIRGLHASGLVWTGYRSTIATARPRRVRAGEWTVTAVLSGSVTRVMTAAPESERRLVRILPAERRRWVFHLHRPADGGPLLLTAAQPQGSPSAERS